MILMVIPSMPLPFKVGQQNLLQETFFSLREFILKLDLRFGSLKVESLGSVPVIAWASE